MRDRNVRAVPLLLGLALAALFCAVTPYNNVFLQNSPLAGGHFPLASFGCLLLLVIVLNPLLSLVRASWRLHSHELLLVWAMVTVATGIAFTGLMRTFIINITTPAWFTNTATPVGRILEALLPPGLFPTDPETIRTLYNGLEGGRDMAWWEVLYTIPWHRWIAPMVGWGAFVALVYTALMGLMGLFTHQWIENEKMNFPLLRVPMALSDESEKGTLRTFFFHKYFLAGCSIPFFLHLLNGLHAHYPQVPQIPTLILMQPYMPKEGLLSGFYKLKVYLYPAFIGFAFLTSKQVSFSLWGFFMLGGLLPGLLQVMGWRLPSAALGTTFGPVLSGVEEMQMIGAFGVFFFFILWLGRYHLSYVVRTLFRKDPALDEGYHGLLSPRVSFWLFAAGFAGTLAWLCLFGMQLLAAFLFLIVCFMLQLVTARLICQGGLPYFTLTAAPSDGFLAFLDTRLIAPATVFLALVVPKVTFVDVRESLMPSLLHASKVSNGARPKRRFLFGVTASVVIGVAVSFAAMLILYYKHGIATLPDSWAVETARRVHENVAQLVEYPEGPKPWSTSFAVIGAVVMTFLVVGYQRFIWWPLHPIGYLTTYSSAMRILWFSFFIGWLVNTLVLRYGGVAQFKEARRFFIGMIVGDMVMALAWMIAGLFSPVRYNVLPL
jgi:hypothetical protein